jgi:hypothetical protein
MASSDSVTRKDDDKTTHRGLSDDKQNADRSHVGERNESISNGPQDEEEYEITVQPNKMKYYDAQGTEHEIHLPRGTSERAGQLWAEENWDELAKFPKWGIYP